MRVRQRHAVRGPPAVSLLVSVMAVLPQVPGR